MDENLLKAIKKKIWASDQILLTSHKRPDGDAVGSLLGLGILLQEMGKTVQMVLEDGVPGTFKHLEGSQQIQQKASDGYDISIVLDCSDLQRIGQVLENDSIPTINIDHHVTNLNFAELNLVETKDPATTVILTKLMTNFGRPISRPAAEAFLTGLITDTIGFHTSNVSPESLRIAADLMMLGADLPSLYRKALLNISYEAARFWGAGLSTLEKEDQLLWAILSQADRQAVGYPGNDDADLVNFLSSINGAEVYIIFVEQPDQTVKVSWRSQDNYDVSQVATSFGGGGHKPAAGAIIDGTLEAVKEKVLKATKTLIYLDR